MPADSLPHHLRCAHYHTLACAEGLDNFPDYKDFSQLCARMFPLGFAFVWAREFRKGRMDLIVAENEKWEKGVCVKEEKPILDTRNGPAEPDQQSLQKVAQWYRDNHSDNTEGYLY